MEEQSKEAISEFEVAVGVIGGKWKPVILWLLGEHECLRFGELQRCIPDVTHKVLTRQLRELESDHLIHRQVYPEVPPRVEYSITDTGRDVLPIFVQMCDWAERNHFFGYRIKYHLCETDAGKKKKLKKIKFAGR